MNAAAIGVHLLGAASLLRANSDRVRNQPGVGTSSAVKTLLTAAAVGATAYSGKLGRDIAAAGRTEAAGGTVPSSSTPAEVAGAMNRQRVLQWTTPALTAAVVIVSALQGEQQRPAQQLKGMARGALAAFA